MPVSLELPLFSTLRSSSSGGFRPSIITRAFDASVIGFHASFPRFRRAPRQARGISMCLTRNSSLLNGYGGRKVKYGDTEYVEVIVVGSRKDAIVNCCFESPFNSIPLRFWTINVKDSGDVQFQEMLLDKELSPRIVDFTQLAQSCPRAIILVASAGYGPDHTAAIDVLNAARSRHGLAAAILLKPFSFEGKKRQDEVKELARNLQQNSIFIVDVDIESLLQKDLVTLDEALKAANEAVSVAIHATSVLVSMPCREYIDVMHDNVKELKGSEVLQILEGFREVKLGFGAGHNLKTSVLRALFDCPFIYPGAKNLSGIVCIVASSVPIDKNNIKTILLTFRQTIDFKGEIIISTTHEPNLVPDMLVTTFFSLSSPEKKASQKGSIFSRLAQHLPFVFDIFKRHPQSDDNKGINSLIDAATPSMENPAQSYEATSSDVDYNIEEFGKDSEELQEASTSSYYDIFASSESQPNGVELPHSSSGDVHDENIEEYRAFQREQIASWNMDPAFKIEHESSQNLAAIPGDAPVLDSLRAISLPVGVRTSEDLKDSALVSSQRRVSLTKDVIRREPSINSDNFSKGFNDTASALYSEKNTDISTKQRNLSARAASMLEAERESPKSWNPKLEMQYKGGLYRGKCQGGLPEGKGRLILADGNIYDGMWRYGKRSGLGTFYFNNGDVFQGTWRDDVIHGKGWFYFHTGDRWFANFWKGKANGEGRFYSKSGDIFFGNFKDGWRHGSFLCIDVDGTRYSETWKEGVLINREQVDS